MSAISDFIPIKILRAVWGCVNVFAAVATVTSAYSGYIPPTKFALAQVWNMTFQFWCILWFVVALINLLTVRRWLWLSLIVAVVSAKSFVAFFPLHITSPKVTAQQRATAFSLLTYNVFNLTEPDKKPSPEWGKRAIAHVLASGADFVLLQECMPLRGSHVAVNKAQADSLLAAYPYYITNNKVGAGELILSKYPVERISLPEHPRWGSGNYDAYEADIDGRKLTIVNCHLQSIGLTDDDKEVYRELTDKQVKPTRKEISEVKHVLLPKLEKAFLARAEQARYIREFLADVSGPVVLAGDFNDIVGSYAWHTMCRAGLRDCYASTAFGPTITYYASRFYFHIDQVFCRGAITPVSIKVQRVKYSDHYPVITTFVWDNPPQVSTTNPDI